MSPNKFFDCIYCINLDRRIDRWKKIEKNFKKLSLKVKRISAVDSRNLDAQLIGTPKQKARYACTESHLLAIKDAVANNYDQIMILEDDCIFVNDFNKKFSKEINKIPLDWEMILFGYYPGKDFALPSKESIILLTKNEDKNQGLWAAHAYALKKSLFATILNTKNGAFSKTPHQKNPEGYGCIDITYYYSIYGKNKCYAVYPPLIMQEKIDTDIDIVDEQTKIYSKNI